MFEGVKVDTISSIYSHFLLLPLNTTSTRTRRGLQESFISQNIVFSDFIKIMMHTVTIICPIGKTFYDRGHFTLETPVMLSDMTKLSVQHTVRHRRRSATFVCITSNEITDY